MSVTADSTVVTIDSICITADGLDSCQGDPENKPLMGIEEFKIEMGVVQI